jgi:hypothetical protein
LAVLTAPICSENQIQKTTMVFRKINYVILSYVVAEVMNGSSSSSTAQTQCFMLACKI